MSNKWIAELIALAISASAITPLGAHESTLLNPGNQIVSEVDASYRKGEYDIFLEQLHEQYENAGKAGVLRGLFESSKEAFKANPEALESQFAPMHSQIKELTKNRNQRLLDAIAADSSATIAKKVDSIIFFSLRSEHSQVLNDLDQLKFHIPESAEGTIENKMSTLETEYYIKSQLLDIATQQQKEPSVNLPKKKIALSLEKLDKMEDVAKEKNDSFWLEKIQLAKQANLLEKAHRVDLDILNGLALGKVQPENSVEQKVKEIMMDYLQQKRATIEQHKNEIAQK